MKQSEWNSYWDKKINEHFNVKPAERIVLREFVENVFNEKYGIQEAGTLSFGDLLKEPYRMKNFIDMVKTGTLFSLSNTEKFGKLDIDKKIPADEQGKVQIYTRGKRSKESMARIKWYRDYLESKSKGIEQPSLPPQYAEQWTAEMEQEKGDPIAIVSGRKLRFETDYFVTDDNGILDPKNAERVVIGMSALEKTAEFGGKGAKKGPDGADWEYLICWALTTSKGNPKGDYSVLGTREEKIKEIMKSNGGFYKTQALNIASKIRASGSPSTGWQPAGGDSGSDPSAEWIAAFNSVGAGTPKGTTMTSKADVVGDDDMRMSFKKAGGAQLMSGGKGESMATIHAVSKRYSFGADEADITIGRIQETIRDKFNEKLKDPKNPSRKMQIKGLEKDLAKLKPKDRDAAELDALLDDPKTIFGQLIKTRSMHEAITADMASVLDSEVEAILDSGLAQQFSKGDLMPKKGPKATFRTLLALESMTGNIKFAKDVPKANWMFCFDPSDASYVMKEIDLPMAAKVGKEAKYYVSFKTSSFSYSSMKIGHEASTEAFEENEKPRMMKLAEKYTKEILDKKMSILREEFINDKEMLNEYKWYMSQSEETRRLLHERLLQEGWLGDKLSSLTSNAAAVAKKIGDKVSDGWDKFTKFLNLAREYAGRAWDFTVDAVVAGFQKAFNFVKDIAQKFGGIAAMEEMGVNLEPGGDSNGMESNPDVASMFL